MGLKAMSAKNLQASVVLFLVALPLNLGVAVSSGVPAYAGIISGVVGSVLVGLLSGAPLMVSGPDAGIGVLVLEMIQDFGIDKLGAIVLIAGLMQVLIGISRSAIWFRMFSPSVVNGMLAGMGLIIILTQFLIMLDSKPLTTGVANLCAIPGVLYKAATPTEGLTHHPAACIGLLTIAVAILWGRFAKGYLKNLPAPLIAILVASVVTALMGLEIQLIQIPVNSSAADTNGIGSLLWANLMNPQVWACGATVAFVASTQSLLTASAVDSATRRKSNMDKELIAQGIGNMVCGLLGALPVAGVLLRSMANVHSGADSRSANVFHGVLILAAVLLIPSALNEMPVCALAAMLVLIGIRMVRNIYQNVKHYDRAELSIVVATILAILATNLFTGVLIGFALAAAKELYSLAYLGIRLDAETEVPGGSILHLSGAATFLHLPRLTAVLESVSPTSDLHVRFDELRYIDHACLELLMDWAQHHREQGGEFTIDWGSFQSRCRQGSLERITRARAFAGPDAV